jgi:hypothetical protein
MFFLRNRRQVKMQLQSGDRPRLDLAQTPAVLSEELLGHMKTMEESLLQH